ncbi:MAG: DUF3011 domain-containing protein [Rhodanobacter sp.]
MNRLGAIRFRYSAFVLLMLLVGCAVGPDERSRHGDRYHGEISELTCASYGNAYRRCDVPGRMLRARVLQRQSVSRCEYGESWGWGRHSIWVDKGCRAEFEVETE